MKREGEGHREIESKQIGKRSEGWSSSLVGERIMKVSLSSLRTDDKREEKKKRWGEKRKGKDGDVDGKQRCE